MNRRKLRILLDARMHPGQRGGVEQVVIGLMHAFARFGAGHEYIFLSYTGAESWLGRYIGGDVRLAAVGPAPRQHKTPRGLLGKLVPLAKTIRRWTRPIEREIETEPALLSEIRPDVIHFNLQSAFRTARPNIYQPWDLQHIHYPEHFSRDDWAKRDYCYRFFCKQATSVLMTSEWGRRDIIQSYGVAHENTSVVNMAPPVSAYPPITDTETDAILARIGVQGPFALYPAQTWPHKNHELLIKAIGLARDQHNVRIQLICTGKLTDHHNHLAQTAKSADVESQIRFLGFTDEATLVALFHRARLLVFPSLFEGWGLPVTEAMLMGVPVVASHATCLPEQLGNAGLTFDPTDHRAICEAMLKAWTSEDLRLDLIRRGRDQAGKYTWERTASDLNSLYEKIGRA